MSHLAKMAGVLGLLIAATGMAQSEPAPSRLDLLQSHWHANQARDHFRAGDRASAILAALRGIPADPTEDDETTYSEAFDALYVAAASGAFQADFDVAVFASFSPSGHRAITDSYMESSGDIGLEGVRLWDTATRTLIADLMPVEPPFSTGPDWGYENNSPFSPDGRLVAISRVTWGADGLLTGTIRVYDTQTGQGVAEVPGVMVMGFSVDGDLLLVQDTGEERQILYDTTSWQAVADVALNVDGSYGLTTSVPGVDNAFYLFRNHQPDYMAREGRTIMYRLDRSGVSTIADLSHLPGLDLPGAIIAPVANPAGPQIALPLPSGEVALLDLGGEVLVRIAMPDAIGGNMNFVRDGAALAFSRIGGLFVQPDPDEVRVYGLDGARLEPRITDLLPFVDFVATPDGVVVGHATHPRHHLNPDPWPIGVPLYERIWPAIPANLRERIDRDRVQRPDP